MIVLMSEQNLKPVPKPEREFEGPIWKHPYFVYIWLSMIPFTILLVAAWLALKNGWLPGSGS
jgi:hypothetical protein